MVKKFLQTFLTLIFIIILVTPCEVLAGTTGKLSGTVKDAQNGDAIPGVNVKISVDFRTKIDVDHSFETIDEALKYYEDYDGSNKTF